MTITIRNQALELPPNTENYFHWEGDVCLLHVWGDMFLSQNDEAFLTFCESRRRREAERRACGGQDIEHTRRYQAALNNAEAFAFVHREASESIYVRAIRET